MSKTLRWLAFSCLPFSFACSELPHESPYDTNAPLGKQAPSRLSGSVLLEGESDHGQVAVELLNDNHSYNVATRNDGTFELTGVIPGDYEVRMTARSFEPYAGQIQISLGSSLTLAPTTLVAKKTIVMGNAQQEKLVGGHAVASGGVIVTLRRTASIRGTAAAPGFLPAAGGPVTAPMLTFTTVSAADGSFSVDRVPPGVYAAQASAADVGATNLGNLTITGESGPVELPATVLRPLTGFFDIEADNQLNPAYTASPSVTLKLVGLNAMEMAVDVVPAGTACEPLVRQTLNALLTVGLAGEGVNQICARFYDEHGNETAVIERTIVHDTLPPAAAIYSINQGAPATAHPLGEITLSLAASDLGSGVASMKVANLAVASTCAAALGAAPSEPYVSVKPWVLQSPSDETVRTVCLSLGDRAGNWSEPYSASILWDTVAPVAGTPAIQINRGALWAVGTQVELTLLATGATEMQLANGAAFGASPWEPFRATAFWVLPASQGEHAVSVNFRDAAGNLAGPFAATITLDSQKPASPLLLINGGAPYTTLADVSLTLSAVDATVMQLSHDGVFGTEPVEAFSVSKNFGLPGTDGTKFVYARFGDDAGNFTDPIAALIVLDRTPPAAGVVTINGGAAFTSGANVTLTLPASGATAMYLSTAGCLFGGAWSEYMPSVNLNLGATTGLRTVYVTYRDEAGNLSACRTAQIRYDNAFDAPSFSAAVTGPELVSGRTKSQTVWVTLDGLTADVAEVALAPDASFSGAVWLPVAGKLVWALTGGDGLRTVYVRARDAAGNLSPTLSPSITLDQTGPEVPALAVNDIDGDGFAVSETQVELLWTAPSDPHLAGYEVEVYVPGYTASFARILDAGPATVTHADVVGEETGFARFYRVRAYDSLGNFSGWSASIQAYPFAPIKQIAWFSGVNGLRYLFTPNRGTFSLRAARTYETIAGATVEEDLGIDITSWANPGAAGEVAEQLLLRAANQDNSLSYETVYDTPTARREPLMDFEKTLAMTRGADGTPYMVNCGWLKLRYGAHNGSAWNIEEIPIIDPCEKLAFAVDAEGKAHILYTLMYSPWSVIYVTNRSGDWNFEVVASAGFMTWYRPSIAVAADGTVHAVWEDSDAIQYAERSVDGTWTVEAMFNGVAPSIAVDSAGIPHVVSIRGTYPATDLILARRTAPSTWNETVIEANLYTSSTGLLFDAAGDVHVAYNSPVSGGLVYAKGPGLVRELVSAGDANNFSMVFDERGRLYIGYADFAADLAKLAVYDGAWTVRAIGSISGGFTNVDHAGAVPDSRGNLHAVYSQYSSSQLLYYHERAGRKEELPTWMVFALAMAFDPNDQPHFLTSLWVDGGKPYYTEGTTGTWVETGPLIPDQVYDASLAIDGMGRSHAVFGNYSNEIFYGLRTGDGAWNVELLAANSLNPQIASDKAGNLLLLYNSGGSILYATATSSSSFVPAQTLAEGMSQRVLAGRDGVFHVVYSDALDGWMRYRTYSKGVWSAPEPIAYGFRPASIAERNGKIWIAYHEPASKTLNVGERRADGTWNIRIIERNMAQLWDVPSIAISPGGWVVVLYEDKVNVRFKLATNATGGWATTAVGPGERYGRLAYDSKDNLVMAYVGRSDENYVLHYVRDFFGAMPAKSTTRVSAW